MKRLRRLLRVGAIVGAAALYAACGGKSPVDPGPVEPPPVAAPVITSVAAGVTRAEVGDRVTVTAQVTPGDGASPLTYQWSATVGTVTGSGASATWQLDSGAAATPADVVVTLTVIKPYQALVNGQLVSREHRVTAQAQPFRVHDSEAEVSEMVRTFLIDYFGDINVSPDACLVDFSDSCPGKSAERADIAGIRENYSVITDVTVEVQSVTFNGDRTRAEVFAPCTFRSVLRADGKPEAVTGDCLLTAVYEVNRWWLCDSLLENERSLPTSAGLPTRQTDDLFSSYFR